MSEHGFPLYVIADIATPENGLHLSWWWSALYYGVLPVLITISTGAVLLSLAVSSSTHCEKKQKTITVTSAVVLALLTVMIGVVTMTYTVSEYEKITEDQISAMTGEENREQVQEAARSYAELRGFDIEGSCFGGSDSVLCGGDKLDGVDVVSTHGDGETVTLYPVMEQEDDDLVLLVVEETTD